MRQFFQHLRKLAVFSLVCLLLSWSFPAQAASPTDSQLEQQVLQILRTHPEVIIESVQSYQQAQQQKVQKTRQAFVQDLKTNTKTVIGESPMKGTTLKTVLIEFSDFECPYCAEASKTLKNLLAKYPNELTLVYKHFPLSQIHAEAIPAAKAAWAANQQGKFWEYHDALFTNQKQLGEALYLDIAKNLNLDLAKFKSDQILADAAVQKDLQVAEKLGLSGTPSFVINSKNFSGAVQLSEIESILASVR